MPVTGIDAAPPAAITESLEIPPTSSSPADPSADELFAELLEAELLEAEQAATTPAVHEPSTTMPRTSQLGEPTVSLAQMVASFAGVAFPLPSDPAGNLGGYSHGPATAAVTGTTGPSDDWGAAAERPASALTGPGAQVLSAGERYLGVPYLWGGTSASEGFDCSGFVQQVYADLGVSLPRVSADQSRAGREVVGGLSAAQPGDLVYWNGDGGRPNHIGIYAGEGKMLVAPRTGDVVRYQEITRTPDAVRRIL